MKKTVEDMQFKGKTTLVRCDFNVPMDKNGKITDDRRILSSLPTINYLREHGAKVILMSHLGRPKGEPEPKFSMAPVARRLSQLLHTTVEFADEDKIISSRVKEQVKQLEEGDVLLLQNTRFRKEEKENGDVFAEELASLGDVFVNDAFGTAHRAHASNIGLATRLPSCIGFLMERELKVIGGALKTPAHPFVAILGGAKVSDKIIVLENLLEVVDSILIVGGMAYTFLKAQGFEIGKSILEEDRIEFAKEVIQHAKEKGVNIVLPVDAVAAKGIEDEAHAHVVAIKDIPQNEMGLDIGPTTVELMTPIIESAGTVIWNGPAGVFEKTAFSKGTAGLAGAMAQCKGVTIVGGGDSAAAVEKLGFADQIYHISTGGGASLKLLEGKALPGISAIEDKGE